MGDDVDGGRGMMRAPHTEREGEKVKRERETGEKEREKGERGSMFHTVCLWPGPNASQTERSALKEGDNPRVVATKWVKYYMGNA